jgi:hypothetical protein
MLMSVRAALVALLGSLLVSGGFAAPAAAADVVNVSPPQIAGTPMFDRVLRADPGVWQPADVTLAYHWLRDGTKIPGARERSYRLRLGDIGHRMSVRVTATDTEGSSAQAVSEPTAKVVRAPLVNKRRPEVVGIQRFARSVTASPGRWSADPGRVRYQWLRGGRPIRGATRALYRFVPRDVGRNIRVRVTVTAPGHKKGVATSPRTGPVRHRVDVRRTVTYRVRTKGAITASVREFRRLAQQTYADPRGWRAKGVRFVPVARGGSFTLWLAAAAAVPSFSSGCSSMWSCRVGRNVIINQTRWRFASPAWNAAHRSLRDYRHMVVNHETGHWLGKGHARCPGPGRLAPVMMQQSKGTHGCRFNPWPTPAELR